jgi:S-DNA-T family DNA segregation ATPase FtsK/SpoIIIE
MAKKKTKTKSDTTSKIKKPNFKLSSQQKLIFGSLLIIIGILLFIAFLSFLFNGKADQSTLSELTSREV